MFVLEKSINIIYSHKMVIRLGLDVKTTLNKLLSKIYLHLKTQ